MGIIGGTPFIGLPETLLRALSPSSMSWRPTVLALAGATTKHLIPMPVRAAFAYKKKIARREYVRVNLRKAKMVCSKRSNFHARVLGCCRRWLTPMDWSNSAKKLRWSNQARRWLSWLCKPDLKLVVSRDVDDTTPFRHVRNMTTTKLDLTGLNVRCGIEDAQSLKTLSPGDFLEVHCTGSVVR